MGKKKKIRRKIAKRVENKMYQMCSCPNEINIILNIILPKKDRYPFTIHCNTDCGHTDCTSYKYLEHASIIS